MNNKIKEAVTHFKNENGNEKFTQKEMLMYIVQRLDNLPCAAHIEAIGNINGDIKTIYSMFKSWRWTMGVLLTILIGLIGLSRIT